jgi:hypothetical protein
LDMTKSFVVTGYQVPVTGKYRFQVPGFMLQGKLNTRDTSYQLSGFRFIACRARATA